MEHRDFKQFNEGLLQYSKETEEANRKKIEEQLWADYGIESTVLVLDMSGFSLLTRKYGIVHYLAMIRRMQLTVEPIIKSHGGWVVKFEADNCFALLPEPHSAVRAAIAIQLAFNASNLITSDELDIYVSMGIDYGRILLVKNEDCFGEAVNRACKMGEDVGTAGEILIAKQAMERIPSDAGIKSHEIEISISGISISAHSIDYQAE